MRVLITGVCGAVGHYFVEYLQAEHPEVEIHGLWRWRNNAPKPEGVIYYDADLTDYIAVANAIHCIKADIVIHLASYANLRESFNSEHRVLSENILGTRNLLDCLHGFFDTVPRLLMVSTCEVYGKAQGLIREDHFFNPISPYAISKATQEMLAKFYFQVYGLPIITSRMFNYINPRRLDLFATAFARQVVRIEKGKQQVLEHGNLESSRTLMDIRDAVRAYWLLATEGTPGEVYNLGSKDNVSIKDFLDILKSKSSVNIQTKQIDSLMRPVDITQQIADTTKFDTQFDFKPRHTLEDSIEFLMNYWRAHE